ncbi:unnamed protein product [Fraxinus pennsylvanica]|uniref:Uncharacterized protein n=1 Tax=Fraxinus pennsylvanica TaxID=56036 RepID=A0AAD2DVV4_9LAMI|nr:unnamed protein product [Fraxinus pennsylvanica]
MGRRSRTEKGRDKPKPQQHRDEWVATMTVVLPSDAHAHASIGALLHRRLQCLSGSSASRREKEEMLLKASNWLFFTARWREVSPRAVTSLMLSSLAEISSLMTCILPLIAA